MGRTIKCLLRFHKLMLIFVASSLNKMNYKYDLKQFNKTTHFGVFCQLGHFQVIFYLQSAQAESLSLWDFVASVPHFPERWVSMMHTTGPERGSPAKTPPHQTRVDARSERAFFSSFAFGWLFILQGATSSCHFVSSSHHEEHDVVLILTLQSQTTTSPRLASLLNPLRRPTHTDTTVSCLFVYFLLVL